MAEIKFIRPSVGTFLLCVFLFLLGLAYFGVGPLPAILMGLIALGAALFLLCGI